MFEPETFDGLTRFDRDFLSAAGVGVAGGRVAGGRSVRGGRAGQVAQVAPMNSLALRRGLSPTYPRSQAYRVALPAGPFFTKARLILLEGAGEEEWTRAVKACARFYNWQGWHLRDSEGVIESLHSLRTDGYCDGLGVPDWHFWHEDLGQSFWAELKGASGALGKYQKREIGSMRRAGLTVLVWYPRDALEVEGVFRYGVEPVA
jgi:hypothetical protein